MDQGKGLFTDNLHLDRICYGRTWFWQRQAPSLPKRKIRIVFPFGLDANDAGPRGYLFDRRGNTCDQPSAADWHNHGRRLTFRQNLQTDRRLACHDRVVVVWGDESQIMLRCVTFSAISAGLGRRLGHQNLGPQPHRRIDFVVGNVTRHHDGGPNTCALRSQRDRLRMIASRIGHHTPGLLHGRQF
jgi:hypothetical protein